MASEYRTGGTDRNANACHRSVFGVRNSTARNATVSSKTIPPWSCTPSARPVRPQAQTPIQNSASRANTHSCGDRRGFSNQKIGNASSVPNVPGAKGMSPTPKPKARKVRWMTENKAPRRLRDRPCDRSHDCREATHSGARAFAAEMVPSASTDLDRTPTLVEHGQAGPRNNPPDACDRDRAASEARSTSRCRSTGAVKQSS